MREIHHDMGSRALVSSPLHSAVSLCAWSVRGREDRAFPRLRAHVEVGFARTLAFSNFQAFKIVQTFKLSSFEKFLAFKVWTKHVRAYNVNHCSNVSLKVNKKRKEQRKHMSSWPCCRRRSSKSPISFSTATRAASGATRASSAAAARGSSAPTSSRSKAATSATAASSRRAASSATRSATNC